MQNKVKRTAAGKKKESSGSQAWLLWGGVGLAIVLFAAIAVWVSLRSTIPFELTGGDDNPLVLLRDETTVYYEFTYTGNSPAMLERIIPRIQVYSDQVLVADVQAVSVLSGDEEVRLEDGYFPEGEGLELQPDETFQVGITYLGQELGWNKIYGFRLQYSQEGSVVDGVLELTDDYYVFVE